MTHSLTPYALTAAILVPAAANKNTISRLRQYAAWLDGTGREWQTPDLAA